LLRIVVEKGDRSVTMKLEGRLAGPWVDETERAWRAEAPSAKQIYLQVDLSGVTFVDAGGKQLLQQMYESGADLVAGTLLSRSVVEEIRRNRKNGKKE
jgi:ABC-type transporter Mla MlaB component